MGKVSILLGLLLSSISGGAFAQGGNFTGIDTMIVNLSQNTAGLISMTEAISYVIGLFLVIKGIFKLAEHSKTNGQVPLSKPILLVVIGICMMLIGNSLDVVTETFYTSANPGGFLAPTGVAANYTAVYKSMFTFLKFVGLFSFVRGFLLLAKAVETGQDLTAKGLTHIVGGMMLYHSYYTVKLLAGSTGLSLPF